MLKSIATIILACCLGACVLAKPLTELRLGNTVIDTDHIDCKSSAEIIDQCGVQQGFSYRFHDFSYPANHSSLLGSCRRQNEALKCLKAHAKCLQPLSRQVLVAMVSSRQKYNKKLCSEKPSETANKVLELNQCMANHKDLLEKGQHAEINAIVTPEAIVNGKIDSVQDRLKHSCCAVAKARKEFMDTTVPHCKQYSPVASEMIDSYLAETVTIICPDFEGRQRNECEKLSKLPTAKSSHSRHFLMPILQVVQSLA